MKSTEVLNPRRVLRADIRTRIHADYMHAYNYTHRLRTCNGKVYGKLDVRQNGGLNHGKQITLFNKAFVEKTFYFAAHVTLKPLLDA